MALPGRVEERGAAWAVVYPGEVTGDVVELIFDNEAGARQTLHIFQLRHCLRTPGFESAVGRLIAEVQAFAREAGEEDVEEWCNGANLHEIRDISLADMVAMLSGEDPDDRHDGGEAAEAVVEAPCGPRSTGSVAPTGPTASPAAAQEQPLAVAVEEGLPGEAAAPSRQAPSPAPNSTGAGAPTPHPAPQQGLAGGGRSTRDALQAADAAGLGAGAAEDPAQAPGGGVDAGEAAASEELELASEHTASDYLGVALVGGCWQARVSLRLDAQGRPSPQADACRQAVAAASELEAALARDIAVLWQERWCWAAADSASSQPCHVFNFRAQRYAHDATLACMLAELPTWPELRAYMEQVQACGFLAAAAAAYDADRLPASPWPDPDSPGPAADGGNEGRDDRPGGPAGGSRKRQRRGDGEGEGGGGAPAPAKRRVGWRQRGGRDKHPVAGPAEEDEEQQQQPRSTTDGEPAEREQQLRGPQRAAPRDAGVYSTLRKSGRVWRAWVKLPVALQPSAAPRTFVLEHADHGVATAAAEVAAFWKAAVLRAPGERGPLHDRFAADPHLGEQLAGVGNVAQLRAALRALVQDGWLASVASLLRPTAADAVGEGDEARAGGAAQPGEAVAAVTAQRGAADHLGCSASQQQPQGQGPASGFFGVMFDHNKWMGGVTLALHGGLSKFATVLRHQDPAVAAAARDVAVFWKLRVLGQGGPRQPRPLLESRYDQDRRLLERLRAVRDIESLRKLLQEMSNGGELQELAAELRRRCPSAAAASGMEAEEEEEQLPASGFLGVTFFYNKWNAWVSLALNGGRSKQMSVLRDRDPAVAAAARDVAVYWKMRVLGQGGRNQRPPLLESRYDQDRGLLERLRAVRDIESLRELLQGMSDAGELEGLAAELRRRCPLAAAASGMEAQRARRGQQEQAGEEGEEDDPDEGTEEAAAEETLQRQQSAEAEQQQQQHQQSAEAEQQQQQHQQSAEAEQQQQQQQHGADGKQQQRQQRNGASPAGQASPGAAHTRGPAQRMPDSGFVGLEFRGGRWQGGMQVRSDEGGSKWVALLSHPDPAMAAAARDVAVYWKTRVRGERGPRQSPAQLEARYEQDEELRRQLHAVHSVADLRQLLQRLLQAGQLDEAARELGRLSAAAEAAAEAAAPRSRQQEAPGAEVAMAAPPAGWHRSLAAWQEQARRQAQAWAAQAPAHDDAWLQGGALSAMLSAGAAPSQHQQQGPPQQQLSAGGWAGQQQAQPATSTGEQACRAGTEGCVFPGAAALQAAAAASPQGEPAALQELKGLLAGLEVERAPQPDWSPAPPGALPLPAAASTPPPADAAWHQPPQRRPALTAPGPGDVVLHCSNCRGVGGLPLLERLLVLWVRPVDAASTPQRAGHRCECLVLAKGAAAGQLAAQALPRPASLELSRAGHKWRAVAVPARTRSWCLEGRVPRQQLEALLSALSALEQQAPCPYADPP